MAGPGGWVMTGRGCGSRIVARLLELPLVRAALAEPVDLTALREKPTPRVWTGLGLIATSYVIGWPAVGLLAWLAVRWQEPLLVVVGGPLTYGLSHLVFWIGSGLAGARYARLFLRWAIRRAVERLGGGAAPLS